MGFELGLEGRRGVTREEERRGGHIKVGCGNQEPRVSEMAQQAKVPVAEAGDLSLLFETYMVEGRSDKCVHYTTYPCRTDE